MSENSIPPDRLYLQFYGEADPEWIGIVDTNDVTWCVDRINASDVEYIRADSRDPAKLEGLLEAVRALVDRIETGSNFCDELTNTIDALAAFEGREAEL